jgi:hypothetical protein
VRSGRGGVTFLNDERNPKISWLPGHIPDPRNF